MAPVSHHILLNANAGTAHAQGVAPEQLIERFAAIGLAVSVDADTEKPLADRLEKARNSPAEVLVAAGGDGTATALAQVAMDSGKALAVMPLGTANLLARDLGLPLTLPEWFDAYPTLVRRRIDVGEVNGRVFLHKLVVGAVPKIAALREEIRSHPTLGAKAAFLGHFVRALSRLHRFAVEITTEGGDPHIERVQSIAVANNDYDEGLGRIFSRSHLDAGSLSLYLVRHLSLVDAIRLSMRMLVGAWKNDRVLEFKNVQTVNLRTRSRRVRVMIDGEVEFMDSPLALRTRPQALEVVALATPEPAVTDQHEEDA